MLNRRGTTWRGLPEGRKTLVIDATSAAALMAEQVSLIKRPILEIKGKVVHAGFAPAEYASFFP